MRVGRGARVIWRWHPENSSFCLLGKKWDISGIIFSSPLGFLTACPIPVQKNLEKQQSPGAGPAPDPPPRCPWIYRCMESWETFMVTKISTGQ